MVAAVRQLEQASQHFVETWGSQMLPVNRDCCVVVPALAEGGSAARTADFRIRQNVRRLGRPPTRRCGPALGLPCPMPRPAQHLRRLIECKRTIFLKAALWVAGALAYPDWTRGGRACAAEKVEGPRHPPLLP